MASKRKRGDGEEEVKSDNNAMSDEGEVLRTFISCCIAFSFALSCIESHGHPSPAKRRRYGEIGESALIRVDDGGIAAPAEVPPDPENKDNEYRKLPNDCVPQSIRSWSTS
jgi:hypothetical protein